MTDHATPTLLERLQVLSSKARCLLATEPDWIMIPISDPDTPNNIVGVLTTSPDEVDGYVIGVYDRDAWTSGVPDAVLPLPTRFRLLQAAEYLLRYWPEGTDWSAWACQRIADDGDTLGDR